MRGDLPSGFNGGREAARQQAAAGKHPSAWLPPAALNSLPRETGGTHSPETGTWPAGQSTEMVRELGVPGMQSASFCPHSLWAQGSPVAPDETSVLTTWKGS